MRIDKLVENNKMLDIYVSKESGFEFTGDTMEQILELLKDLDGIAIMGEEPLEEGNQQGVYNIIMTVKEGMKDKKIWLFTNKNERSCPLTNYTYPLLERCNKIFLEKDGRCVRYYENRFVTLDEFDKSVNEMIGE